MWCLEIGMINHKVVNSELGSIKKKKKNFTLKVKIFNLDSC